MKVRIAKGTQPSGRTFVALIIEAEDGLHVTTVCIDPEAAKGLAEAMRLAALEVASGLVLPGQS